jgi:hypothetical protein
MIVAAKALAVMGADLFSDHQSILDTKADFHRRMEGKTYKSVIPADQKPPLKPEELVPLPLNMIRCLSANEISRTNDYISAAATRDRRGRDPVRSIKQR